MAKRTDTLAQGVAVATPKREGLRIAGPMENDPLRVRIVGDPIAAMRSDAPPCDKCGRTGLRMKDHWGKAHKATCPGCKPCNTCGGTGRLAQEG